jgi:hypothetical protein
VQDVALVDDQFRVEERPSATDVGVAEIDTVGMGGGGGVPVTLTRAEVLALPSGPLQVSEKPLLVLRAPVGWLPEVGLVPDQAPAAEQEVAFVEFHVSMDAPPPATEVGFAASVTDGPAGDSSPAPPHAVKTSAGTSNRPLAFKVAPHSWIAEAITAPPTGCIGAASRRLYGWGMQSRPMVFGLPLAHLCRRII